MEWDLFLGGLGFICVGGVWVVIHTGTLRRRARARAGDHSGPSTGTKAEQFAKVVEDLVPMDLFGDGYLHFSRVMSWGFVAVGVVMVLSACTTAAIDAM